MFSSVGVFSFVRAFLFLLEFFFSPLWELNLSSSVRPTVVACGYLSRDDERCVVIAYQFFKKLSIVRLTLVKLSFFKKLSMCDQL